MKPPASAADGGSPPQVRVGRSFAAADDRLPAQHRHLMPQHHDLQLLERFRPTTQEQEHEQPAQRQVAERPEQEQLLEVQAGRAAETTRESDPRGFEPS
jgi:hypothetical protein